MGRCYNTNNASPKSYYINLFLVIEYKRLLKMYYKCAMKNVNQNY